jgi:hypothetical protein
VLGQIDS